ncbi:MAG: Holliday junction resolvase RuvX [Candidatus Saccharimonadales bacterium]
MSSTRHTFVGLDIGEKRIGVASADNEVRIAFPVSTVMVDGLEISRLREIVTEIQPSALIVGYPRNQKGEATAQTAIIIEFAQQLEVLKIPIVFQDESLTSVLAEEYLKRTKKNYTKSDIDSHAAAIILGDYLETTYGY